MASRLALQAQAAAQRLTNHYKRQRSAYPRGARSGRLSGESHTKESAAYRRISAGLDWFDGNQASDSHNWFRAPIGQFHAKALQC